MEIPDSLAILLTPPGAAAIAVVRLTGPRAAEFVASHLSRPAKAGRVVHAELVDGSNVIDDPLVVLAADGRSIDINLHGGPWVVRSMLNLAAREGFQVVDTSDLPLPTEAVEAESPLEAEMLQWLPAGKTEMALSRLLAQPAAWQALHARLLHGDKTDESASAEIADMRDDASLLHLLHPPRLVIIGVPNVGKSTLANALFAQERSITADLPGTTRDWVGEIANLDGFAAMLVDTPGIRQTADLIESQAIERAGEEIRAADLVVLVFDATQPLDGAQSELFKAFPAAIQVVNKIDAAPLWDIDSFGSVHTSARQGRGIDDLRKAIRDRFGIDRRAPDAARWWTAEQRAALNEADSTRVLRWMAGKFKGLKAAQDD